MVCNIIWNLLGTPDMPESVTVSTVIIGKCSLQRRKKYASCQTLGGLWRMLLWHLLFCKVKAVQNRHYCELSVSVPRFFGGSFCQTSRPSGGRVENTFSQAYTVIIQKLYFPCVGRRWRAFVVLSVSSFVIVKISGKGLTIKAYTPHESLFNHHYGSAIGIGHHPGQPCQQQQQCRDHQVNFVCFRLSLCRRLVPRRAP